MAARAPEEIIRDWLADNGPTRVKITAFEQTWGIERMGSRDRRRVAAALASVGVTADPPLARISRTEEVLLALEEAAPVVEEPTGGGRTRAGPSGSPSPKWSPSPNRGREPEEEVGSSPSRLPEPRARSRA